MIDSITYRINFDKVMFILFCAYAFSMPFELILEIWWGIDTIFKPFRIISLVIIASFGLQTLRKGLRLPSDFQRDIFLYAVFIYGVLISLIRLISGIFHLGLFYNDLFQTSLYVTTFFIFKAMLFSTKKKLKILKFLVTGVIFNALYIGYTFVFQGLYERGTGFADNPNYVALGLIVAITYFALKLNNNKGLKFKMLYGILILLLIYIFITAGSRTGLVMLIVANFFIFIYSSFRVKLTLLFASTFIVLLLFSKQVSLGGPLILIQRLSHNLDKTSEDVRFIVWKGALRTLENESYMGIGIGQFKAKFPQYFGEEPNKLILEIVNRGFYLSTHNDYLAILTDYGLPGLLFYLIFLFLCFRAILKRVIYPTEDEEERFLARYNFIIFTCLIIFGMAAENFQNQLYWFLLMFATNSIQKKPAV